MYKFIKENSYIQANDDLTSFTTKIILYTYENQYKSYPFFIILYLK